MRRIAGQALVRSMGSSLHMACSRRGAKSQADALVRMAKGQMKEVTHEQLLQAKLQQALEDKQGLVAANAKLRQDRWWFCSSSTHALVPLLLRQPCVSLPGGILKFNYSCCVDARHVFNRIRKALGPHKAIGCSCKELHTNKDMSTQ